VNTARGKLQVVLSTSVAFALGFTMVPSTAMAAESQAQGSATLVAQAASKVETRSVHVDGGLVTVGETVDGAVGISLDKQSITLRSSTLKGSFTSASSTTRVSTSNAVDNVVEKLDRGVRVAQVIKTGAAATTFTYTIDGAVFRDRQGAVVVEKDGQPIGAVDPAWAVDAAGKNVTTWYTVESGALVQHVNHIGAAYPVVADPRVTLGRFVYVTFNRSETTRIAGNVDYAALVAAACGLIPFPPASVGCSVIVGVMVTQTANTFKSAAGQSGKCAQMRWFWDPPFWGAYAGSSVVNC
jgi:hypothetical protein